MEENQTIVALATPLGKGAIALIRLSGNNTRSIVEKCCLLKSGKTIEEAKTHTIHYGTIQENNKKTIDSVLFFIMDGPRSFTGENSIEITCHNNPFIIHAIIQKLIECGARSALPGEFTERAVLNKKIDILQAEAINDLLCAQSELETQLALGQLEGTLSAEIHTIDNQISTIAAWCQASFEFLDEERDFSKVILQQLGDTQARIDQLLEQHNFYTLIKEGLKIGIVGNTNVGKSSLLNAILKEQKAIVTDIPGTTRDIVEGVIHKDGMYWTFFDTAGIRMTADLIEQTGIKKSYQVAEQADILLVVFTDQELKNNDTDETYKSLLEKYNKKIILIKNKVDNETIEKTEDTFLGYNFFEISARQQRGINIVLEKIQNRKEELLEGKNINYLINLRHVDALKFASHRITELKDILTRKNPLYEIILIKLYEIQGKLTLLSGKTIEEKSFDQVFRSFCVGK